MNEQMMANLISRLILILESKVQLLISVRLRVHWFAGNELFNEKEGTDLLDERLDFPSLAKR